MAELLLKVGTVGPDPRWQDGDIVCCFSDRIISQRHLDILAHPRHLPPGRRAVDSHCFDYFDAVCRYKFERISALEVRRTDRVLSTVDVVSKTPNAAGERINVATYVRRHLATPNHKIFGASGREIWFGGKRDYSAAVLDGVWTRAEARDGTLKANFPEFPITARERRHFLPISIDDPTDAEVFDLLASDVFDDMNPSGEVEDTYTLRARATFVEWENLAGMNQGRRNAVRDPGRSADHRQDLGRFPHSSIRQDKPLIGRRSTTRL